MVGFAFGIMFTICIRLCTGQPAVPKELTPVTTTTRTIQVEHIIIRSTKSFAEVRATLEHSLPKLNPEITSLMASGDAKQLQEKLEAGPELAIFLSRDHGGLLRITGHARKAVQYEIGNPLTASKMTRHQLAAGLYAPLRVLLYEDQEGGSVFEYDRPSSLFGQFGDRQLNDVARGLDVALERALRQALE
jgi:uncharacterized protein (DUF302 family)